MDKRGGYIICYPLQGWYFVLIENFIKKEGFMGNPEAFFILLFQ